MDERCVFYLVYLVYFKGKHYWFQKSYTNTKYAEITMNTDVVVWVSGVSALFYIISSISI